MDSLWRTALWKQFGAAIDMLDNAVVGLPRRPLAAARLALTHPPPFPQQFAEFWYVAYHTLFWLDLYLFGAARRGVRSPSALCPGGVIDSAERGARPALCPGRTCAPTSRLCARNAARPSRR